MMFLILALGLTLVTATLILRPLLSPPDGNKDLSEGHDKEVYKDQLEEIERDLNAGTLSEDEAELARVEISRRLISASERTEKQAVQKQFTFVSILPMAFLFLMSSAFIYVMVGNPLIPDQPLALRDAPPPIRTAQQPVPDNIGEMVAQAEAHLAQNPDDGRGWDVLAPIYFRMGEYFKAQNAYAKAIALEGSTPLRHAGMGEAIMRAQEGIVTGEAKSHFERALELDPKDPRANFFLGLELMQSNKNDEAIVAFENLARNSPANAPWIQAIRTQIAIMKNIPVSEVELETSTAGQNVQASNEAQPLGNPSAEDIEAASEMNAEDRMMMINSMVSSLSEKLAEDPNNFEGWMRLIRSFKVLGRDADASNALETALSAFAPDTDQGKAILEMAKQMNVTLPTTAQ